MRPTFHRISAAALLLVGCDPTTTAPDAADFAGAPSGARYMLQFVVQDASEGEIVSAPFPAGGVVLDARDPWKNLTVQGAPLTLVSPTHGDTLAYPCSTYPDVRVNWEIAGTTGLTFAGDWTGELRLWTTRGGQNLAYRATAAGGRTIDNVATNNNAVVKTTTATGFSIRFTNARMGFGSPSKPDGATTLGTLPGYEAACANFTIVASRM